MAGLPGKANAVSEKRLTYATVASVTACLRGANVPWWGRLAALLLLFLPLIGWGAR
jgi:hypothetical protein